MKFTTTDSNGNTETIGHTAKKVLCLAKRRGYGWTIKPDTRAKHPLVKPHVETVLVLDYAPSAGRVVMAQYSSSFGE